MVQKLHRRRRAVRKITVFVLVRIRAYKISENGQPVQDHQDPQAKEPQAIAAKRRKSQLYAAIRIIHKSSFGSCLRMTLNITFNVILI
jgi:hypothetical protein